MKKMLTIKDNCSNCPMIGNALDEKYYCKLGNFYIEDTKSFPDSCPLNTKEDRYIMTMPGGSGSTYITLITKEHYKFLENIIENKGWEAVRNTETPKEFEEKEIFFCIEEGTIDKWPFNDYNILGVFNTYGG